MDELSLPQANDLIGYWSEFPPVHILVRGYVGFKGSKADEPRKFDEMSPEEQDEAMAKIFNLES